MWMRDLFFEDAVVAQSISGWQNQKSSLQSFIFYVIQDNEPEWRFCCERKAANLSLFTISLKWITSGKNAGNL